MVEALTLLTNAVRFGPRVPGSCRTHLAGMLGVTAFVLARETRSLLTGESASPRVLAAARAVLEADPRVTRVHDIGSLLLGPSRVLLAVTLELRNDLTVDEVRRTAEDLRRRIEATQPIVSYVFFRLAPPD